MLKQDFKEDSGGGDGEKQTGENQGDGTQIRTYINNVTIKVMTSDITSSNKKTKKNR